MAKIELNSPMDFTYALGHRDAVHVPLVKMSSDVKLSAGMKVKFDDDCWCTPVENDSVDYDGIVNPFLPVTEHTAWILVHPRLVDGTVQHFFQIKHESMTEQMIMSVDDYDECRGCY